MSFKFFLILAGSSKPRIEFPMFCLSRFTNSIIIGSYLNVYLFI